jgi:hypothetical protein
MTDIEIIASVLMKRFKIGDYEAEAIANDITAELSDFCFAVVPEDWVDWTQQNAADPIPMIPDTAPKLYLVH